MCQRQEAIHRRFDLVDIRADIAKLGLRIRGQRMVRRHLQQFLEILDCASPVIGGLTAQAAAMVQRLHLLLGRQRIARQQFAQHPVGVIGI